MRQRLAMVRHVVVPGNFFAAMGGDRHMPFAGPHVALYALWRFPDTPLHASSCPAHARTLYVRSGLKILHPVARFPLTLDPGYDTICMRALSDRAGG